MSNPSPCGVKKCNDALDPSQLVKENNRKKTMALLIFLVLAIIAFFVFIFMPIPIGFEPIEPTGGTIILIIGIVIGIAGAFIISIMYVSTKKSKK